MGALFPFLAQFSPRLQPAGGKLHVGNKLLRGCRPHVPLALRDRWPPLRNLGAEQLTLRWCGHSGERPGGELSLCANSAFFSLFTGGQDAERLLTAKGSSWKECLSFYFLDLLETLSLKSS